MVQHLAMVQYLDSLTSTSLIRQTVTDIHSQTLAPPTLALRGVQNQYTILAGTT